MIRHVMLKTSTDYLLLDLGHKGYVRNRAKVTESTHERGHTLDLVITRPSSSITSTQVDDMISDHNIVSCSFQMRKPSYPRRDVTYRKMRSIDHESFRADLHDSVLLTDPADTVETLAEQYDETLGALLDKHAPLKKKTLTIRPRSPWMCEEILEARKVRRRLERRWRSSRLTIEGRNILINGVEAFRSLPFKATCPLRLPF